MDMVHFFVVGRVQGVGFRRFVAHHANLNHLTGWVKNTPDSMVEVLASGKVENITPFLNACRKGPLFAHVTDIHFVLGEKQSTSFPDFSIIR